VIDWITVKPAILAALVAASGIVANNVGWYDQSMPFNDFVLARVKLKSVSGLGVDEPRYTDGQKLYYYGNRVIVITVYIDTLSQENGETSSYYIETLRTSLNKQGIKSLLRAVNVAYINMSESVEGLFEDDGRVYSRASVNITLATSVYYQDTDSDVGDYIATADIEGTVT